MELQDLDKYDDNDSDDSEEDDKIESKLKISLEQYQEMAESIDYLLGNKIFNESFPIMRESFKQILDSLISDVLINYKKKSSIFSCEKLKF